MNDEPRFHESAEARKPRTAGPRLNVRNGIQGGILVALLILFFTAPPSADRQLLLLGAATAVGAVDLVMLLRGDMEYTHFQSRQWSIRINAALLALAIVVFALVYTGRLS